MLDLRDFYLNNVKSTSRYIKYHKEISTEDLEVNVFDDIYDVTEMFKELIQPENTSDELSSLKFYLVCFYLNYHSYYIVQFPNYLSYPTDLVDFSYNKIRNYLIAKDRSDDGKVRWVERRKLIEELDFKKKESHKTNFHESIEDKFREISTRGAAFDNMHEHEKLEEIANYLEHALKVDGKYISIKSEEMIDLISDDFIKKYRATLQCYRHSSKPSLEERKKLEGKENYLIYLGISIIHGLHALNKS